jgi:phosphomethylpyrimidine synthase
MRALVETAWQYYVQMMAEGQRHIPMEEYQSICKGVPFFSPGMVTSDLAVGHEHIAAAIGGAQMAWCVSLIGGLKSQTGITDMERVKTDLLSYKIAAHSADMAKGHPGVQVRDNAFSKAKQENRRKDCIRLPLGNVCR